MRTDDFRHVDGIADDGRDAIPTTHSRAAEAAEAPADGAPPELGDSVEGTQFFELANETVPECLKEQLEHQSVTIQALEEKLAAQAETLQDNEATMAKQQKTIGYCNNWLRSTDSIQLSMDDQQ